MDLNEFRSFISDTGVDVWTWIDMSISLASTDHEIELRSRRDGIIQKLYAPPFSGCEICVKKKEKFQQNHEMCNSKGMELAQNVTPVEEDDDDENDDDDGDEQRKILEIKSLLDDRSQNEKGLIDLLQRLLDMNTTFKTLKETEIGRHVTKLRKHSSNQVRMMVKVLVRKWKETVDEWVRQNTPTEEEETEFHGDRKLADARIHKTPSKRKAEDNGIQYNDEDYRESQHAKKQTRTQVMDISKLKNSVVSNNGGGSVSIKYW